MQTIPGERRVRFVARDTDNNTEVSCRAEQRDGEGVLLYSTTETVTLRLLPPGADLWMDPCAVQNAEWWCGYELVLYLLLVLLLFLIITCCGICFCCSTRRRAKKVIYTSPEAHESQEGLIAPKPVWSSTGPVGGILKQTWEPTFFPPRLSSTQTAQVTNTSPIGRTPALQPLPPSPEPEPELKLEPKVLESDFDAEQSFLDESLQDQGRPHSQPSTIGNFYSDDEGDRTFEEETAMRHRLLMEYEEQTIINRRTQITTIQERLKRIDQNKSMNSEVSDTESLEDEVKQYEAHQYNLRDCADISSRDFSYSQVVKEHLSHNPSLNVSKTDVTFTVPAAVSRLKLSESCTGSRSHSPMPPHSTPTIPKAWNPEPRTLPSTARLPVHKPTNLNGLPTTPKKVSNNVTMEYSEKRTSKSTTVETSTRPKTDREIVNNILHPKNYLDSEPKKTESFSEIVGKHLGTSQELLSVPINVSPATSTVFAPALAFANFLPPAAVAAGPPVLEVKTEDSDSETDSEENLESFATIVEKHLGLSQEALDDHVYALRRQVSLDGSCFTAEMDFNIVDPNCNLTIDDIKKTFIDLRDKGKMANKEMFVKALMDFFPKYNMEQNIVKLEHLFDRLDKNREGLSDGLISFRQFMLVTIAFSNISLEEKLTRIFKLIDKNDNGELTYAEFEEVVYDILVLKEERKMSTAQVQGLFSENTFRHMGMNSEGKVVLKDFVEACTQQKFILINYVENFRDGFQSS